MPEKFLAGQVLARILSYALLAVGALVNNIVPVLFFQNEITVLSLDYYFILGCVSNEFRIGVACTDIPGLVNPVSHRVY